MKRYYVILFVLALGCIVGVQAQEGSDIYLFSEFEDATVHYRDGAYTNEKINYDIARNQFAFLTKELGEIRNVTDIDDILIIRIGHRTFYPEKTGGVEILSTNPDVYVQYRAKSRVEAPKGAYGLPSETSSIRTYSGVSVEGKRYELNTQRVEIIRRYNVYWIEQGNKKKEFKNFKQFTKLYSAHKAAIDSYIKAHDISFEDTDMIVKLCAYAESL